MFENSAYADSAWTNNQTGVLAAENLVVNITGTTALIGSIIWLGNKDEFDALEEI